MKEPTTLEFSIDIPDKALAEAVDVMNFDDTMVMIMTFVEGTDDIKSLKYIDTIRVTNTGADSVVYTKNKATEATGNCKSIW